MKSRDRGCFRKFAELFVRHSLSFFEKETKLSDEASALFRRKTVPHYMYVNEYFVHRSLQKRVKRRECPFF
ncbi:hypothetical protein CFN60_10600 [Bacillus velezensis]|nr:hypothetical protein CFN60_10600 [Bacillus velezensis]ATV23162.1 hypothetical protein CS547_10660 [Bacillus sp. Lzh-5]MVZ93666.1 hypothetical protein [Bacillus velezensis]